MPYTKNSWEPGDIITAAKLNHMEDGIAASDLSESVKTALLQIASKVAYIDDQGQEYYDALEEALYPEKTLTSITAEYTQTSTVYATTSLDSLKSDLVVTANYDDASTATVTTYTLSGTLSVGTSTITVTYSGFTDTFEVTVSAAPTVSSIAAVYTQSGTVYTTDTLDSLKSDLVVTATYSDSSTATVPSADYTLSGTLTVGTSTITVSYESKTTSFNVTVSIGLDSIAYGAMTYRDIFITNNFIALGDFESTMNLTSSFVDAGGGWAYKINAGSPSITTDAADSPTHSLKCYGTGSTQIIYSNPSKTIQTGSYLCCCAVKVPRYVQGNIGMQVNTPAQTAVEKTYLQKTATTDGFVGMAAIHTLTTARTGMVVYIGTYTSANADAYVDDVVITPLPSGLSEADALTLYNNYCAIRRAAS